MVGGREDGTHTHIHTHLQGRNFGLKSGGTNSGVEKVAPLATETKREFCGRVRDIAAVENGFSVI